MERPNEALAHDRTLSITSLRLDTEKRGSWTTRTPIEKYGPPCTSLGTPRSVASRKPDATRCQRSVTVSSDVIVSRYDATSRHNFSAKFSGKVLPLNSYKLNEISTKE